MPRARIHVFASLLLGSVSCAGPTSHEFDVVDTPQAMPSEVPEPVAPEPVTGPKTEPTSPEGCGKDTGRNATGTCEKLRTRQATHVQQVQIPAGRFVMGDVPRTYATELTRHDPRELWPGQPPRYAESGAFWIDLHEVTRGAYEACVQEGACTPALCPDGSDPVEKYSAEAAALVPQTCVTHEQAEAFCRARGGRLPTEIEWEYAARGVDARMYPWGNDMRDEYTAMLMPISGNPSDSSYFGIIGMGTSAIEWVADAYEIDHGLAGYVTGPFRRDDGPLRRAEATRGPRFVMKGGKTGARRDNTGSDKRVGFRCAADLGADETGLTVPAEPPSIPLLRDTGLGLLVFGGVAEAIDQREAESFCSVLRVEFQGRVHEGWRLPTLAEVQTIAADFRGPGPFWGADGAMLQQGERKSAPKPDDPWIREEAEPGEPLAARCVLGTLR